MTAHFASITLRPFALEDISAFAAAVNNSLDTLLPWMVWAHENYEEKEAASWINFTHLQRATGEAHEFAIVDEQDRLLGGAGIRFSRFQGDFSALGYWVRSDVQGKGIASQAVNQLLKFGFERPAVKTIEILAAEANTASRRVAEKCGGRFVDYRYGLIILDSGPVNTAIYHFHRPQK
jgi:RimJ/RimL family protein N-acetyltransferase